jgi:hypothetical protein
MCEIITVYSQRYTVFFIKSESDQFRSFWTIFKLCSYPIITKTLYIEVEGLLFYKSNLYVIVCYTIIISCYKIILKTW